MRREPFTIAGAFWLALSGLCSAILIASVPVYLSQLGQVTEVEQSIESLLGIEGTAARLYFEGLTG